MDHKDVLSLQLHNVHVVQMTVPHRSYSPSMEYADIALLKTMNDISFSEHVQPIRLSNKLFRPGFTAMVIGHGSPSNFLLVEILDIFYRYFVFRHFPCCPAPYL
uniref:Peptidase S1 domain-containing protein n=1 Tax=Steinernema glaseri TaxID=37863 RepID=A0A1I7YNB6_9BILA